MFFSRNKSVSSLLVFNNFFHNWLSQKCLDRNKSVFYTVIKVCVSRNKSVRIVPTPYYEKKNKRFWESIARPCGLPCFLTKEFFCILCLLLFGLASKLTLQNALCRVFRLWAILKHLWRRKAFVGLLAGFYGYSRKCACKIAPILLSPRGSNCPGCFYGSTAQYKAPPAYKIAGDYLQSPAIGFPHRLRLALPEKSPVLFYTGFPHFLTFLSSV